VARILLGVSGGIAAYKAVELVRLATAAGHSVRVVQTPNSLKFVGPATFEAVSGAPVLVDEFERDPARGAFPGEPAPDHDPISHLELVRRADVLCLAPASANTIAKLANGLADNLLTGAALASDAPLVVAPAMNDRMFEHPATSENLETLRRRGAVIVPPGRGRLASKGEWGVGRLAEPDQIQAAVEKALAAAPAGSGERFAPRSLDGLRVLVTAGGTREPIDSVRYLGNRSSGRMGLALAEESARRGAEVTLVCANVALPKPAVAKLAEVETAAELLEVCRKAFDQADVLLMAAAVSDFRPREANRAKISKAGRDGLELDLEPTEDVLAALSAERQPDQTLVGFAAEHGKGGGERAREKLERKGLDMVVLNDISRADIGFDAEHNEVTLLTAGAERAVPRGPKGAVAAAVLDEVESLRARGTVEAGDER
jgi:phosphopantothenoylcysteine decarboxylase/phosphopantothenate--cysteine ligase